MLVVDALQFSKPTRARFEEWRAGKVSAVHVTLAIWEDSTEAMREVGRWLRLFEDNADIICPARTVAEIRAAHESGRTAVILGFQNSTPFESDLDLVGAFQQAGVRIAQLTYNTQNSAGAGCWESDNAGLSRTYGRNLIKEMNEVGMLVDVSHCNERTVLEAFEASEKPVVITHANPLEVVGTDVELPFRNKSTTALKEMAAQGGVVGLSMYPRIAPNGINCTLDDYCDMVLWTIDLLGIDHVAFGSDYYAGHADEEILWWRQGRWSRTSLVPVSSFVEFPGWFNASSGYPSVLERLSERGLNDTEVAAVAGENWLRVFDETFGR
jgi:membrane dipeptidase